MRSVSRTQIPNKAKACERRPGGRGRKHSLLNELDSADRALHIRLDHVDRHPHVLPELHWPAHADEHTPRLRVFLCVEDGLLRAADEIAQAEGEGRVPREQREPRREVAHRACALRECRACVEDRHLKGEPSCLGLRKERSEDGEHSSQAVCI